MANFVLIYHGGKMPESPEEGAAVMTAWTNWFGQLGAALVDGGNPVSHIRHCKSFVSVTVGWAPMWRVT